MSASSTDQRSAAQHYTQATDTKTARRAIFMAFAFVLFKDIILTRFDYEEFILLLFFFLIHAHTRKSNPEDRVGGPLAFLLSLPKAQA